MSKLNRNRMNLTSKLSRCKLSNKKPWARKSSKWKKRLANSRKTPIKKWPAKIKTSSNFRLKTRFSNPNYNLSNTKWNLIRKIWVSSVSKTVNYRLSATSCWPRSRKQRLRCKICRINYWQRRPRLKVKLRPFLHSNWTRVL